MNDHYAKNFLTSVIFRVDFSPILKIDNELPAELQDEIRTDFPEYKKEENITQKTIVNSNGIRLEKPDIHNIYIFSDIRKKKIFRVQYNYISLENKNYQSFSDFKDDNKKLYNIFSQKYRPLDIKRIGLRYINEIVIMNGNPLDHSKLSESIITGNPFIHS